MDPMVLIGGFALVGILFLGGFVAIMLIVNKGKPPAAHSKMDKENGAAEAARHINNANNF